MEQPKHHEYCITTTLNSVATHATTNTIMQIEALDGADETPWT